MASSDGNDQQRMKVRGIAMILGGMVATGVALTVAAWWPSADSPPPADPRRAAGNVPTPALGADPGRLTDPGPLTATPVAPADALATSTPAAADAKDPLAYGRFPSVPRTRNVQVAGVYEALEQQKHPERLSPMILPPAFSLEDWRKAPQAYLDQSVPGRVWQTLAPGKDVPRLRPLVAARHEIAQHETVTLRVLAAPDAPVSFQVFDGGVLENSLPAMTVRTDADGVASVTYTATPGVSDDVHILSGSPLASGQVRFVITVRRAGGG